MSVPSRLWANRIVAVCLEFFSPFKDLLSESVSRQMQAFSLSHHRSLHNSVAEPGMRIAESSLSSLMAVCSLSFSSVPLIIACLAVACLNHVTTNSGLDWQMFQALPLTRAPSSFCLTLFGSFNFEQCSSILIPQFLIWQSGHHAFP